MPRDEAWVAELTHMADLSGWPKGMRLIVRKERPHPGVQLRTTDIDGQRAMAQRHHPLHGLKTPSETDQAAASAS